MELHARLLDEIKKELLEICDTETESRHELERYRKEFTRELDFNIYQYGLIRPYYHQIRQLFVETEYPSIPASDDALLEIFKRYIRHAVVELLDPLGDLKERARKLSKYESCLVSRNGRNFLLCGTPLAYEGEVEGIMGKAYREVEKLLMGWIYDGDITDVVSTLRDTVIACVQREHNLTVIHGYEEY